MFLDYFEKEFIIDAYCGDSHAICVTLTNQTYGWGQGISKSPNLIKELKESSAQKKNKNR